MLTHVDLRHGIWKASPKKTNCVLGKKTKST